MAQTDQGPTYTEGQVVSDIQSVASSMGVDPSLALATAYQESGLNPYSVGDSGTSFGLYQLHEGGELGSMSPAMAFDPTTNAQTALSEVAQVAQQEPGASPGQIAADAQRPADKAGYANAVNSLYASIAANGTAGIPGYDPNASFAPGAQQAQLTASVFGVHIPGTGGGGPNIGPNLTPAGIASGVTSGVTSALGSLFSGVTGLFVRGGLILFGGILLLLALVLMARGGLGAASKGAEQSRQAREQVRSVRQEARTYRRAGRTGQAGPPPGASSPPARSGGSGGATAVSGSNLAKAGEDAAEVAAA